jgi:hypothetical protein
MGTGFPHFNRQVIPSRQRWVVGGLLAFRVPVGGYKRVESLLAVSTHGLPFDLFTRSRLTITHYCDQITIYYNCQEVASMDGEKPIISFRIRSDIKEALQELALADRRSLSSYIELALEAHVDAHRSRPRAAPLDRPLLRQLAKQTKKR